MICPGIDFISPPMDGWDSTQERPPQLSLLTIQIVPLSLHVKMCKTFVNSAMSSHIKALGKRKNVNPYIHVFTSF